MESYKLFYRNKYLGNINYDEVADKFSFDKSDATTDFPARFSTDIIKGTPKDNITDEDIRDFIENRVVPKNRQYLDLYLSLIGLNYYDEWEIFKRLSGMFSTDPYWINSYGAKDFYKDHFFFTATLPSAKYIKIDNGEDEK